MLLLTFVLHCVILYAQADTRKSVVCKPRQFERAYITPTCVHEGVNFIIYVKEVKFGYLENDAECNETDNLSGCEEDVSSYQFDLALERMSGRSQSSVPYEFPPSVKSVKCNNNQTSPSYFVAYYECIDKRNAVKMCTPGVHTAIEVLIWNDGYPDLAWSPELSQCDCALETTADELIVNTYDNRLTSGETLTIITVNDTTSIRQWDFSGNRNGQSNVNVTSSDMVLSWNTSAAGVSKNETGRIWIGIQTVGLSNLTFRCPLVPDTTTVDTTFQTDTTTMLPDTTNHVHAQGTGQSNTTMYSYSFKTNGRGTGQSNTTIYSYSVTTDANNTADADTKHNANLTYIIGGSAGAAFIILIVVVCIVVTRRRNGNRDDDIEIPVYKNNSQHRVTYPISKHEKVFTKTQSDTDRRGSSSGRESKETGLTVAQNDREVIRKGKVASDSNTVLIPSKPASSRRSNPIIDTSNDQEVGLRKPKTSSRQNKSRDTDRQGDKKYTEIKAKSNNESNKDNVSTKEGSHHISGTKVKAVGENTRKRDKKHTAQKLPSPDKERATKKGGATSSNKDGVESTQKLLSSRQRNDEKRRPPSGKK